MRYCPWHHEVHGVELAYQAIDLLSSDMALCGQDDEQLEEILEFSLQDGDRA